MCFPPPQDRCRFAMIEYRTFQSKDRCLDMADTFACSGLPICAKGCTPSGYCNVLADPKRRKLIIEN